MERRAFEEFDALAEAVRGWDLDWLQLDGGALDSEYLQVGTGSSLILRARFSRRFLQCGSPPPGLMTFGLLEEGVNGVNWCRNDATDDHLLAFDPTSDYEALSSPGFGCSTVSFTEEHLGTVATDLGLPEAGEVRPRGPGLLGGDRATLTEFRSRLRRLYGALVAQPDPEAHPWLEREIESEIPALLLKAIEPTSELPSPPRPAARAQAIRFGRAYIEEHAASAPTIREVCRAAGVSWRTLDYAFREHFGITPKAYLQAVRLDGVRRDLRRAEPGTSVSEIAAHWGFWHQGQLAADYRRQFDELPSDTKRR